MKGGKKLRCSSQTNGTNSQEIPNGKEKEVAYEEEASPEVDETDYHSVLSAIKDFVTDLGNAYKPKKGNKGTLSLNMYKRLVDGLTPTNEVGISKVVDSFNKFFLMYNPNQDNIFYELPVGAQIKYNDKIFINIQYFIHRSPEEIKDTIVKHLEFIAALIIPDEKTRTLIKEKRKKKTFETPEGEFLKNIMGDAEGVMKDMGDTENPMTVIAKLASGGVLNNMISGIKKGMDSGQMDPKRLMNVLHNTADNFFETAKSGMSDETSTGTQNDEEVVEETQQ